MPASAVMVAAVAPGSCSRCCSPKVGSASPTRSAPVGSLPAARGTPTSYNNAAIAMRASSRTSSVIWRAMPSANMAALTALPACSWRELYSAVAPKKAGDCTAPNSASICAMRRTRTGERNFPRCTCSKKRRITTMAVAYSLTNC